jgi:23S rRNA G2445 N2-methylase RlmL
MPSSPRLFALTTAGLESVSAGEIASFTHASIRDIGYRRIAFTWSGAIAALPELRTVDDLFVDLGVWADVGHRRDELVRLSRLAKHLDPAQALALCRTVRPVPHCPSFAVSASFVGRRNYTVDEIKQAIAQGIHLTTSWTYRDRDDSADLSIRVFIEHDRAYLGMRLGRAPLHDRSYRTEHRGGALKPSVAAAMLRLTTPLPGVRLLDPCCGTGTIVIEAARAGMAAMGFDRDARALALARRQADAAGVSVDWAHANAERLPIAEATVDRVITNLPWGRQTSAGRDIAEFYARCIREILRVLTPRGCAALLVERPELVSSATDRQLQCLPISLYGRRPAIVLLHPGAG